MKIFLVRVKPDYRWSMVTVDGRHFSKADPTEIQEGDLSDEVRNSPLLEVTEVETEPAPAPKRRPPRKG